VKNSEEAVYNLMHSTGAVCLIVDRTLPSFVGGLVDKSFITVDISVIPKESRLDPVDIFWDSSNPSNAGFSRNADLLREADNVALYMHTSGTTGMSHAYDLPKTESNVSTGHPKPIGWTHQFILSSCLSATHDRSTRAEVIYTPFPLFHVG
jgi:acyl-CoA synthetase (AMP-forming)/AMP-acid ligase II